MTSDESDRPSAVTTFTEAIAEDPSPALVPVAVNVTWTRSRIETTFVLGAPRTAFTGFERATENVSTPSSRPSLAPIGTVIVWLVPLGLAAANVNVPVVVV